jgi:hypothetical protein
MRIFCQKSQAISDETSDNPPATESSDQTKAATHDALVYRRWAWHHLSQQDHAASQQGRSGKARPQSGVSHLPGQARGQQVLSHPEEAQNQEIQPCPVYDETLERRTAGMAGKAEAGRAERPGEV